MLLEFSHANANKILTLFNEDKIAQLNVQPVTVEGKRRFMFDYILMDSLDTHRKSVAMKTLSNPNSLMSRMRIIEILNQFIENMATDTVTRFTLEFSVIDRATILLNTQVQFAKEANTVTDESVRECFKNLQDIVTKMGIHRAKVEGVFRKEGSGKSKKTVTMTVGEIVDALAAIGELSAALPLPLPENKE